MRRWLIASANALLAPVVQAQPAAEPAPAPLLRLERSLGVGRAAAPAPTPAFARAARLQGALQECVELIGDAEVRREGTVLRGDRIRYTVATDEVQIEGNARVFRDGTVFTGPSLRFFVDAARGEMPQASFSYAPRQG
ncbi:MAG: LPS-assembly protein LptD, partial [Sutterellaceae bacterium]|nr:LPS-assembly protein LptD [Burkholderiaceae bacterium]MDW8429872.1 LPS-assembly protein LptD [Sutterellaceae bacterium]